MNIKDVKVFNKRTGKVLKRGKEYTVDLKTGLITFSKPTIIGQIIKAILRFLNMDDNLLDSIEVIYSIENPPEQISLTTTVRGKNNGLQIPRR